MTRILSRHVSALLFAAVPCLMATALIGQQQADPAEVEPKPLAEARDVVVLTNGEELVGQILTTTPTYIELRMGRGTVVGFARRRIASIRRAAVPAGPRVPASKLPETEDWFALHDGEGRVAGQLHASTVRTDAGGYRLSEEWSFRRGRTMVELTVLEVLDANLEPKSSFYHERTRRGAKRIEAEHLVRAIVEGGSLVVEQRGRGEPIRMTYPMPVGTTFPLALRARRSLRAEHPSPSSEAMVFDSRRAEFVTVAVETRAASRRVPWRGETLRVQELVWRSGERSNLEWLDASARSVRREINGPSLVAVRRAARDLPGLVRHRAEIASPGLVRSRDDRFGLWRPNPSWRDGAVPETRGARLGQPNLHSDQVLLLADLYQGSAMLAALDHLDPELDLWSAADATWRWLQLSHERTALRRRAKQRIGGREAVVLEFDFRKASTGRRALRWQCRTFVFRVVPTTADGKARFVALNLSAPAREFDMLEHDFETLAKSIELHLAEEHALRRVAVEPQRGAADQDSSLLNPHARGDRRRASGRR